MLLILVLVVCALFLVCEEAFTAAGYKTPMDVQSAMRNVTDKKQVDMGLRNMGIKQMRLRKGPLLPMRNAISMDVLIFASIIY